MSESAVRHGTTATALGVLLVALSPRGLCAVALGDDLLRGLALAAHAPRGVDGVPEVPRDPRVVVTDLEARLGTVRTADTVARLQALYPGVRFVWLMGADNLVQFHLWERWQEILWRVPVGVLARPGWGLRGRMSKAARVFSGERVGRGEVLRMRGAPVWCFVNLPMDGSSSSEIRARGDWRR